MGIVRAVALREDKDSALARSFSILLLYLAVLARGLYSGGEPRPSAEAAQSQAKDTSHISIGQPWAPLFGPWRFHVGDSPVDPVTHTESWAAPDFDDSSWETVDLTPKHAVVSPYMGEHGYVPGWTARGHEGYWGYAWYRLRVHLDLGPGEKLALAGPEEVDDAYQVFLNGTILGSFGDITGKRHVIYYSQPMMFDIARPANGSQDSSDFVFAFRVWMEPNALVSAGDPGGLHSAPVLGDSDAVTTAYKARRLELIRFYSPFAVEALLYALLAVVAFSLILFDRSDRVYLWIGSVFVLTAAYSGFSAFDVWTTHLSIPTDLLITEGVLGPLAYAGWIMVWWTWFRRKPSKWLPRVVGALTLLYVISYVIANDLPFVVIPHPVSIAFELISLLVRLVYFGLLLWIVAQGIRRHGPDGWLVLPAIVMLGIGVFINEFGLLHIQLAWFPFGVRLTLAQIANLVLAAALALLLLRRLMQSVRRQRLIALDAKRAQLQSDFVAAVSHEFRSPLTTLRTITELLAQDRIPSESRRQQSYVFLDRETTRLQRLVEDLLDFGRMESGRKQYRIETHDAFQLVRATLVDFSEQAEANGFRIEVDLHAVAATVEVDDEAFRRAFRNLLENAMKYSPECRTVWVDGTVAEREVSISVRDQGMGIDAMEHDLVFQKFVRGQAAKRAGIKGTGIGLAMVRQISEAMGGEIRLQSEVGVGSTFTIVLPLAVN
jgi:signal transduction histidine kinase